MITQSPAAYTSGRPVRIIAVDGDRAPGAQRGPGRGGQADLGPDTDDDQDHVSLPGHGHAVGRGGLDPQPGCLACRVAADLPHSGAGQHLDPTGGQLGVHQRAQAGVDGGQDLG